VHSELEGSLKFKANVFQIEKASVIVFSSALLSFSKYAQSLLKILVT